MNFSSNSSFQTWQHLRITRALPAEILIQLNCDSYLTRQTIQDKTKAQAVMMLSHDWGRLTYNTEPRPLLMVKESVLLVHLQHPSLIPRLLSGPCLPHHISGHFCVCSIVPYFCDFAHYILFFWSALSYFLYLENPFWSTMIDLIILSWRLPLVH